MWQGLGNDPGRDMLVAKHLVDGEASLKRGPFANGGLGWLLNSPRYYWVIAALWSVTGTPYTVTLLWAIITSLSIPLAYFIGKKYFDSPYLGLLFASFLAIHPRLVYLSHHLLQPNFTAYWSLVLLGSLFASIRAPTLFNLLIFVTVSAIPLHIHYGILLVLPVCFIWFLYLWHELLSRKLSLLGVVFPPLLGVGLALDWVFTTYRITPFDQVYFVLFNFQKTDSLKLWEKCQQFLQNYAVSWTGSKHYLAIFYSILIVVIGSATIILYAQKHKSKATIQIVAIISLVVSLIFSLLFNGYVFESYLDIFIIPTCFLLALSLWQITQYSKILGILPTLCLICLWYINNTIFFEPQKILHTYSIIDHITQVIDEDYQGVGIPVSTYQRKSNINYILFALDPKMDIQFDGWSTTSIWYLLEEKYGIQLVKLSEGGVNISPLTTSPDYAYVICTHYGNPETSANFCKQAIKHYKPYLYPEPTLISQDNIVLIFRYPFVLNTYIPSNHYFETIIAKDFYIPNEILKPTMP
jgi:hypothetical protein